VRQAFDQLAFDQFAFVLPPTDCRYNIMPAPKDRAAQERRPTQNQPRRQLPKRRNRFWAFVRSCLLLGFGLGALGAAIVAALVWTTLQDLPSYQELVTRPRGQSVTVRAADGSVLAHLGPNFGQWLPYDEIPKHMRDAMVAVEDRRFYSHGGFDPVGFGRALYVNIKAHRWVQGGSTITQQVAKNLFLTSDRTFDRKGREVLLSLAIDWKFSKQQILELYLNRVYFGGGAYGIDAAARRFYGHSARSLSIPESVVIAGLVKAPSRYAPSSDPRKSITRARVVLATMVDSGAISPDAAQNVRLDALRFVPQPRENDVRYFTDWVLTQVETLTDEVLQPIDVMTTLDPRMQRAAEAAVQRNLPKGLQAALVALGYDGSIKAMVGGRDYISSSYNRAIYARRQPGSAFKLFVYLAALESGHTPDDIEVDEPITFGKWSPSNSNRTYAGNVTLTRAFAMSINTVAVKLADEAGFDTVASVARRLGISTPISREPAMALGASVATVMDMTGAYATVARGGSSAAPYAIRQIVRADSQVLFSYNAGMPDQVINADTAAMMTKMMAATIESGTGRAAQLDRPAAGKTGTTSDNKDGWFLGFTGDLTAGVWLGRDDNKAVAGLAGGKLPARVWADFMRAATAGLPPQPLFALTQPGNVSEPDDEVYGLTPPGNEPAVTEAPMTQGDGGIPPPPQTEAAEPRLNEAWLNQTLEQDTSN
jgi:penicillin-binding protein 1A